MHNTLSVQLMVHFYTANETMKSGNAIKDGSLFRKYE